MSGEIVKKKRGRCNQKKRGAVIGTGDSSSAREVSVGSKTDFRKGDGGRYADG